MGKVQRECYLVNAPLNPLCQPDLDEDSSSLQTVNYASGHKNTSLKLFHYQNDDATQEQIGLKLDKENTLREVLPSGIASKQSKKEKPKTSEQGRREKEEKISQCINGVSRDLSMEDTENQEFCFTLHKLKGHKNITMNDTEGLVQAIHDALGNSIELPPSGSRTVKVKLAISPNSVSSQEKDDMFHCKDKSRKKPLYAKKMGNVPKENSVNLSSPEKESLKPKCHDISSETTNFLRSSSEVKPNICFAAAPKFKQGYWSNSLQRRRDSVETGCLDCPSRHGKLYMVECQHKQHRKHHCCYRNHSGEGFGHRDTYWKKNINEKVPHGSFESFSYGTCDKNYLNRQAPNHHEDLDSHCIKKLGTCSHQKSKSYDTSSTIKHSQNLVFSDQKDNLSDVNFDPCDPLPEKKFNWEHKFIQKCPESHGACDHSKSVGMNSPKVQLKTNSGVKATGPEPQTSPNYHHRYKHREYEKMQTIQQVADQLENTHLGVPSKEDGSGNTQSMFQKYHHFHEHVHYHYYHYLPT
ncbi:uncharacterized protein LOC143237962 isoform X2 [Tachypleus tridentatus]|uniref:uncharacterized protein LOC143237962 isoform X2 n=1 Tax=Tachypleus tridentatus TaxID=6853 RepID=UPI003FD41CD3